MTVIFHGEEGMKQFTPLLLDVWREVCRHIEIGESVERVAPILVRRLPVHLLLVRRLDLPRFCLETVATGLCDAESPSLRAKNDCSEEAMEKLLHWMERRRVVRETAASAR